MHPRTASPWMVFMRADRSYASSHTCFARKHAVLPQKENVVCGQKRQNPSRKRGFQESNTAAWIAAVLYRADVKKLCEIIDCLFECESRRPRADRDPREADRQAAFPIPAPAFHRAFHGLHPRACRARER